MMRYGLLGGKLGHSISPQIHERFFHYTGIKGSYELLESSAENLPEMMRHVKDDLNGCNVTIPHKVAVMPFLDSIAPEALAIGAVNTISMRNGKTTGYNTDYFGFGRMLEYNGIKISGRKAAVLGSGGAARAVVKYLADKGAEEVYLVTRTPENVDKHFKEMAPSCKVIDYTQLKKINGDVLVNCTPVGMYPKMDASPVTGKVTESFGAVVDIIYNPMQTVLLRQAAANGKKTINGLFMLVAQAVAAEEIWQERQYDSSLILKIMKDMEQNL
ncbi:MAG: shikimate dehydrogenase [Phascolarctobacterium sp.]|nr:shikimate dehydrogenase [Phascolarctobacterium sp.]